MRLVFVWQKGLIMYRNALNDLLVWKDNPNKKPLIVWGARQVGKTYLVKTIFAETYYKKRYIYVDFKADDEVRTFCQTTANAKKIIDFLELWSNQAISEKTLLIFDEVQECPNIISALKYFCQDAREVPVIATGSMVRIKIQRETHKRGGESGKFLFPVGKIQQLTIYPMTFDEFLRNSNERLYERLRAAYESKETLPLEVHNLALEVVQKYLLIGGMPEAVDTYLTRGNLLETREILKGLYENYLADMDLYQASREAVLRSRNLFQNIYKELNKENKNFSPGLLEEKAKTRDYATAIQWLEMAHIIHRSFQLKERVTLPLFEENETNFRIFLADIGMFSYQSGINATSFISSSAENTLSGIFYENFVANELAANEIKLFYWRGKASAELEFILASNGQIFPMDVKKGRGSLNSLEKFAHHNKFTCAIKISKNHYGYNAEQKLLTVPFYYISFLVKELAQQTFNV